MVKNEIGVIVLNYKNYHETIECVDTLIVQENVKFQIIIVDNGSGNESAGILATKYHTLPFVHFINLKKNIGFACGNNVGIKYAREKLHCEFIMVLNSDTILTERSILSSIEKCYENNVGVINCRCIYMNHKEVLPSSFSDNIYYRFVFRVFRDIILYFTNKKRFSGSKPSNQIGKYSIQGCAYVLTPAFFEEYSQIYPGTFLYNEEDALALYLKKAGLYSKFMNNAPIIHKLHRSTGEDLLKIKHQKKLEFKNKIKIALLVFLPQKVISKRYS